MITSFVADYHDQVNNFDSPTEGRLQVEVHAKLSPGSTLGNGPWRTFSDSIRQYYQAGFAPKSPRILLFEMFAHIVLDREPEALVIIDAVWAYTFRGTGRQGNHKHRFFVFCTIFNIRYALWT